MIINQFELSVSILFDDKFQTYYSQLSFSWEVTTLTFKSRWSDLFYGVGDMLPVVCGILVYCQLLINDSSLHITCHKNSGQFCC
jgi:hypothetical protein